jgi:hypothetical protein
MNETTHNGEEIKGASASPDAEDRGAMEAGAREPVPTAPTPPGEIPPRAIAHREQGLIAPVLGGAVVGAIVSAAILWFFSPDQAIAPDVARRFTALESSSLSSAGLEKRIASLESAAALEADKMAGVSAYGPRLSALEAAAPDVKSALDAGKSALGEAQATRADAAKALQTVAQAPTEGPSPAPVDSAAIEARLGKLEAGVSALANAPRDDSAIADRLSKLEAALAAPKSAERVAPDSAPDRASVSMLAVATQALEARLAAGSPYPIEQEALERLGADPTRLAQLKQFARDGAPSIAALTTELAGIAPALLSAAEVRSDDGIMGRLMADMGRIVRVHPVGEQAGDDPAAVISQINAALARGDAAGALADFGRLPEASRAAGKDWAAKLRSRVDVAAAAQALLDESITRLGAAQH